MIRSSRIPNILRKGLLTDNANPNTAIQTALLVTTDGELLGSTASTFISPDGTSKESIESLGTLIADIAVDYSRMGEEYAVLDMAQPGDSVTMSLAGNSNIRKNSHLQCLLLELELGLVGVSMCVGIDCMVIAIASPNAPLGMVKARLQAITEYVQEALSPLTAEAATYG
ncbi:hypothetical protein IV203_018860 [Nitzschia inconspicua]|uniref:Uncharacterized protein n=1 Tax=Nitzschia inconspicua TaxID=303405 RepID=A0A9K3Q5X4_9STRA|nr:hypothetical protein IV203_018860 [Nitzschia inconspicua]